MSRFKASIYNYISNSINAIVMLINGIVLVPLYFQYMSLSTYGAWLATGNVVAMLGMLESGLSIVITQKLAVALKSDDSKLFSLLSGANILSAIIITSVLFLIGLVLSIFVADLINVSGDIRQEITIAFIIALAGTGLSVLVSLFGAFPQVWQETKTVGLIGVIVNIVGILSTIIYLLAGFGVIALALAYFTRSFLNLIGQGVWILLKWKKCQYPKPQYDLNVVNDLLKDCFYPFLSKISSVITNNSQSFIIAVFINPGMAAIYDITQKVTIILSNFVNMTNVSFFALYSLTFASKNKTEINSLIKNVLNLFAFLLFTALLYATVFTRTFVHFWVGLDKYGGDILLVIIVCAVLISQIKQYTNILLQTGGMIAKSSKIDILSMFIYLLILMSIIKHAQIYAIPIATFVSGVFFIGWYLRLLKTNLLIDVRLILKTILKFLLVTTPFAILHFVLNVDLLNIKTLLIYGFSFSILYLIVLLYTNKAFVTQLLLRIKNGQTK